MPARPPNGFLHHLPRTLKNHGVGMLLSAIDLDKRARIGYKFFVQSEEVSLVAFVVVDDSESIESALKRFKRKVQQEAIIKEIKKHSVYYKPGEKRRMKEIQARKRMRRRLRRERYFEY